MRSQRRDDIGNARRGRVRRKADHDTARDNLDRLPHPLLNHRVRPAQLQRHEGCCLYAAVLGQSQQPVPRRPAPLRKMLGRQPVSARHLVDHGAGPEALVDDPRLHVIRPTAPARAPGNDFHPANEAAATIRLPIVHRTLQSGTSADSAVAQPDESAKPMGLRPRLLMTYRRLEAGSFVWPPIRDGMMHLTRGQFAALLYGLDWMRVAPRPVLRPGATN